MWNMWNVRNVPDDTQQTPNCAEDQLLAWKSLPQKWNGSSRSTWSPQVRAPRSLWCLETSSTLIVLCEIKPVGIPIIVLHRYIFNGDCSLHRRKGLSSPVKPVWIVFLAKATRAEATEISQLCSGARTPSLKAGRGPESHPISLGSVWRIAWGLVVDQYSFAAWNFVLFDRANCFDIVITHLLGLSLCDGPESILEELSCKEDSPKENRFCFNQNQDTWVHSFLKNC